MATSTADQDLCKLARQTGAQQALFALGLGPAPDMEKDAFAPLAKGLWAGAKAVGRGIFGSGAKATAGASRGGLVPNAWNALNYPGKKVFGQAGKGIMGAVEKGTFGKTIQGQAGRIRQLGKGFPSQMAGFGVIQGGIEGSGVLDPNAKGWDWGRAAKGFGHGAALGAGFGIANNAYKMGLTGGLNKLRAGAGTALQGATKPGFLGGFKRYAPEIGRGRSIARGLKGFGSNVALGGGAFVASDLAMGPLIGGSITGTAYDALKGSPDPSQPPVYARPQMYAPAMDAIARRGRGYALGRLGLTPYNQGYSMMGTGVPWTRGQQ